jgi:hypothetical protein
MSCKDEITVVLILDKDDPGSIARAVELLREDSAIQVIMVGLRESSNDLAVNPDGELVTYVGRAENLPSALNRACALIKGAFTAFCSPRNTIELSDLVLRRNLLGETPTMNAVQANYHDSDSLLSQFFDLADVLPTLPNCLYRSSVLSTGAFHESLAETCLLDLSLRLLKAGTVLPTAERYTPPAAEGVLSVERLRLFRLFFDGMGVKELTQVFKSRLLASTSDSSCLELDMASLHLRHRNPVVRFLGAQRLLILLEDEQTRNLVHSRLGLSDDALAKLGALQLQIAADDPESIENKARDVRGWATLVAENANSVLAECERLRSEFSELQSYSRRTEAALQELQTEYRKLEDDFLKVQESHRELASWSQHVQEEYNRSKAEYSKLEAWAKSLAERKP